MLSFLKNGCVKNVPKHFYRLRATSGRNYSQNDGINNEDITTMPTPKPRLNVRGFLPSFTINSIAHTKKLKVADLDLLKKKRMLDSLVEELYLFTSDQRLHHEFVNYHGSMKLGKLMEDLDALAGSISHVHCGDFQDGYAPLTIVTASVDRIDILNEVRMDLDMKLSGFVSWTGTSSMEITIRVESYGHPKSYVDTGVDNKTDNIQYVKGNGKWHPVLLAKFSMVARHPVTNQAITIPSLAVDEKSDKQIFEHGAENKRRKKQASAIDLSKKPPTPEEFLIAHILHIEALKIQNSQADPETTKGIVFPSSTELQTTRICHPQQKNIHGAIFGGFLIRESFELAYCTAHLFSITRPTFVALDEITFKESVPVGSILIFTSNVEFAEGGTHRSFQISVVADVVDPCTGSRRTTNTFHYTFKVSPPNQVDRLLPQSYAEMMRYLAARRRKIAGKKSFEEQQELFSNTGHLNP